MRRLLTAAVAASLAIGAVAIHAMQDRPRAEGDRPIIDVGRNVHVSRANAGRAHLEVDLAADPRRPGGLVGCSMIIPPPPTGQGVRTITYYSGDAGASWRPTLEVETGVISNADPTCVFGPDGTAYFVSLEQNRGAEGNRVVPKELTPRSYLLLYRSMDGGRTWSTPQILRGDDRPWLAVDHTDGKRRGTVYLTTKDYEPNVDGGAHVSTLRTHALSADGSDVHSDTVATPATRFSNGVVLSDGTYVAVFGERSSDRPAPPMRTGFFDPPPLSSHRLKSIVSTDGARSFFTATAVGSSTEVQLPYAFTGPMSLAADKSSGPFRDHVYLTWADIRSGRYEILLARSEDKGKTWSSPVAVNDDGPPRPGRRGPDHYMPVVRVNSAGVVGITWYDRRNVPDNIGHEVRFAASFDGGDTFLPSVRVSEAAHTLAHDTWSASHSGSLGGGHPVPAFRTGPFLRLVGTIDLTWVGHTAGLAVTPDDAFHALWVDNRTGVSQVWTCRIAVRGTAVRHGSPELDTLTDVSQQVTVYLGDTKLVRSTGIVTTTAHIVNTSAVPLARPLKLRAIALKSHFGRLIATNADNGLSGPGAMWDFSAAVDGAALAPGGRTLGRELTFRVDDVRQIDGGAIDYYGALHAFDVNARVFAKPQNAAASKPTQ